METGSGLQKFLRAGFLRGSMFILLMSHTPLIKTKSIML